MNDDEWVSIYQFRMLAGCDKTTVEKAIDRGYLEDAVRKTADGKIRIHKTNGRINWAKNWPDTATSTPKLREFLRGAIPKQARPSQSAGIKAKDIDWETMVVSEARRIRESAKARQEQLNLEVRLGNLVHIDDVRAAQFDMVAIFRQAMQQIPPQVSPHLGLTVQQQSYLLGEIEKRLKLLSALTAPDYKLRPK